MAFWNRKNNIRQSQTAWEPNFYQTPPGDVVLTSGSDIDRPAYPQPQFLPAGLKLFTAWRPNNFRDWRRQSVGANYGSTVSLANFGWRYNEYGPGIGLYPGTVPSANRPMYNNLTPILWGLRDLDPTAQAQPGEIGIEHILDVYVQASLRARIRLQ